MKDIRFVVVHRPGPKWRSGAPLHEQEGVHEHVAHYRKLHEAGKLDFGGPFLDAPSGGMMIPAAGLAREEIEAFAAADPAIRNGLLHYEVRAWLIGMKRDS